tara:strand:- start:47 stop:196 length:150 start_codon:yes stop_codon:yes gene_type:complete
MRLNCNDIEMLLEAAEEKREDANELVWRDYTRLIDKLRTYADQLLDCEL